MGMVLIFLANLQAVELEFLFFLLFAALFILRVRAPKTDLTVYIDLLICFFAAQYLDAAPYFMLLIIFEGIVTKKYFVLAGLLTFHDLPHLWIYAILTLLTAFFLLKSKNLEQNDLIEQSILKNRIYELENLNEELASGIIKDINDATVAERSRISRDIHDNAGHDIIAAYMAFQTMGSLIDDDDILDIHNSALERLENGVGKIRNILHNLTPNAISHAENLAQICADYPLDIRYNIYGNTEIVPVYIWNVLEICLKEGLTNAIKHGSQGRAVVQIDVAPTLVRLSVENAAKHASGVVHGRGVSNLRYRVTAIGGNLSTNHDKGTFKLIAVLPLQQEEALK